MLNYHKFFGLALSIVLTPSIRAQSPLPSESGTVLRLRTTAGDEITDSIAYRSDTSALIVRVTRSATGKVTGTADRRYRITEEGIFLVNIDDTQQLLFPSPWPPTQEWSYSYRGQRYRYRVVNADTLLVLPSGAIRTQKILLTVSDPDRKEAVAATLYTAWNLGFVARRQLPDGAPGDYALVEVRSPAPLIVATPAISTPDTVSKGGRNLHLATYFGLNGWAGVPLTGASELRCDGCYDWGVQGEVGTRDGPVGVRGRYSFGWVATSNDTHLGQVQIAGADLVYRFSRSSENEGYLAAGPTWTLINASSQSQQYEQDISVSIGWAGKSSRGAVVFEATYFVGGLPFGAPAGTIVANGVNTLHSGLIGSMGYRFF